MKMTRLLIAMLLIERRFWMLRYIGRIPSGVVDCGGLDDVDWLIWIGRFGSTWQLFNWQIIA